MRKAILGNHLKQLLLKLQKFLADAKLIVPLYLWYETANKILQLLNWEIESRCSGLLISPHKNLLLFAKRRQRRP